MIFYPLYSLLGIEATAASVLSLGTPLTTRLADQPDVEARQVGAAYGGDCHVQCGGVYDKASLGTLQVGLDRVRDADRVTERRLVQNCRPGDLPCMCQTTESLSTPCLTCVLDLVGLITTRGSLTSSRFARADPWSSSCCMVHHLQAHSAQPDVRSVRILSVPKLR